MNHLDPYGFEIPEIFPAAEPDSPLNLVTSCACEFWFDGLDASTFTLNGVNVIQWDDKSGFGRHVLNAIDAQRPTYDINTGRVAFIAANSTFLQSAAFGVELSQPNTIFIVYKIIGVVGDSETAFDAVANLNQSVYYAADAFKLYAGATLTISNSTDANDNIHCTLFDGANSEYWINGISRISGDAGNRTLNGITIGAFGNLLGNADIESMEVIGYNCVITTAERNAVTAYLNAKWGVY